MKIEFDRFEGSSFDVEFVGTIRIKVEYIEEFLVYRKLRKDLYQAFGEDLFKQILDSGSKNSKHFMKIQKAFIEDEKENSNE